MNEENKTNLNQESNNIQNDKIEPVITPNKEVISSTPTVSQASVSQQTPSAPQPVPPKKGGNFKYVMTIFLFIGLFAMIFFLPNITETIKSLKENKKIKNEEIVKEVTTGVMNCTLSKAAGVHETTAIIRFHFTDKKLKSTTTETTTVFQESPIGEERDLFESQQTACLHLKEVTKDIKGFDTDCTQNEKIQTTTEKIDYETLDRTAITENIVEFNGTAPEFQLDQNIDDLQSIMEASGYTCERN